MNAFCLALSAGSLDLVCLPGYEAESISLGAILYQKGGGTVLKRDGNKICLSFGDVYFEDDSEVEARQRVELEWSEGDGQVKVLTDPCGLHSLFYTSNNGVLYVGSAVRDLAQIAGKIKFELNSKISSLLRYGYFSSGATPYSGIVEIKPNRTVRIGLDGKVVDDQHRDVRPLKDDSLPKFDSIEEGVYWFIRTYLERRSVRDKPVGVLLGGFDSALVVSILSELGREVQAFTFVYDQEEFNQPFLDEIEALKNVSLNKVVIRPDTLIPYLQEYSEICNYPTMWLGYVLQTVHLCRIASDKGVARMFSGDGCDTLFLGYPSTYRRGSVHRALPKLPSNVVSFVTKALDSLQGELWGGHVVRVVKALLDTSQYEDSVRPYHAYQVFNRSAQAKLFKKEVEFSNGLREKEDEIPGYDSMSYERKVYGAKSLISPNRAKLTASFACSGLPVYSPYLDPGLKSFVSKVPDSLLREAGGAVEGKELLMRMAERYTSLSSGLIRQKKLAAIASPIDSWIKGELRSVSESHLKRMGIDCQSMYARSILSGVAMDKVYKRFFSSDNVTSTAASLLATLGAFYEER